MRGCPVSLNFEGCVGHLCLGRCEIVDVGVASMSRKYSTASLADPEEVVSPSFLVL